MTSSLDCAVQALIATKHVDGENLALSSFLSPAHSLLSLKRVCK